MSWDKPPDGYSLCFVRVCYQCQGTGFLQSDYCGANDMGDPNIIGTVAALPAVRPPPVPCPNCIRGFQIVSVDSKRALVHLLKDALQEDDPRPNYGNVNPVVPRRDLRQILLDVIIKATEERMVEGTSNG